MRQNIIVALLAACLTLLVVQLLINLRQPTAAFGQAAGATAAASGVVLATANTQNEVFLFLYDVKGQKLASYSIRGNTGIDLKGVRYLKYDFFPDLHEYPGGSRKATAVDNMRQTIDKLNAQRKKKK